MSKVSNLSDTKYGYDIVVAVTQASINSELAEYLHGTGQPMTYICFLADENGNPKVPALTLDELLKKSGNINPFDIPDATPHNDPRITTLTSIRFMCGFKIKIGLPPGVLPNKLPVPIVTLGSNANNVSFTMYCSDFVVVQNTAKSEWSEGAWHVWSQPSGSPWYIQTSVDLIVADLDTKLNTPYFNQHPEEKAALLAQLKNLSSTGFSLQQLLFDLDTAILQTTLDLQGIPKDSAAYAVLWRFFVVTYGGSVKEYGAPVLQVRVVSQDQPDPSGLRLTGMEREVCLLLDKNGDPIPNPTPEQLAVTTLNYLGAVNDNKLPPARAFTWNWVEPEDVGDVSGMISIKRATIGNYFLQNILPVVKGSCITADISDVLNGYFDCTFASGATPQKIDIKPTGELILHLEYRQEYSKESRIFDPHNPSLKATLTVIPQFYLDLSFSGSTITLVQRAVVYISRTGPSNWGSGTVYDTMITDKYDISVGQDGGLVTTVADSKTVDTAQYPSADQGFSFGLASQRVLERIKKAGNASLKNVSVSVFQNFIFPGSKVFTYKSINFSNYQDLVGKITYLKPKSNMKALLRTRPNVPTAPKHAKAIDFHTARTRGPRGATLSLQHSSDIMQNYVQGEIVSPQGKFEALQTGDGHALLFAVDTEGVFHVIEEESGKSHTGWTLSDLSTKKTQEAFGGAGVAMFDVGQSVVDGTVGLAMGVSYQGSDRLLASLQNSSTNTSWIGNPTWTEYPFDAKGQTLPAFSISSILFSETSDQNQYLIVDIDRSTTTSSVKDIVRYHIDPSKATGSYWVKHDVPIDIEHGSYQSCVAKAKDELVDGVCTMGTAGGKSQLVYVPIVNAFGSGPPAPVLHSLPGGVMATAIASARNDDQKPELYGTTELYAIAGTTVYYFSAEDLGNEGSVGRPIITNSIVSGTSTLKAMVHDGVVTLWARNGSNQVYYLSCHSDQVLQPTSWSAPVSILSGVEQMSPYVNRTDGGNTIFTAGGPQLKKLTQATDSSSKLWKPQDITLTTTLITKSISFNSHTTTLHITDATNQPAKDVPITITAKSRLPVYINGLYYVLGQSPVTVKTDAMGAITIIETVTNVNGAILTISVDGQAPIDINPMDKAFDTLAKLNSSDSIRNATLTTGTVAGGIVGPPQSAPLIDPSTHENDVKGVAHNMDQLKTIYHDEPGMKAQLVKFHSQNKAQRRVVSAKSGLASSQDADPIAIAVGDLFQWLESGIEAAIQIVQDAADGVWKFVATIANSVYHAILDTAEAVVGAVSWLFTQIKTAVEDIIRYVSFLFEWDDIRRTKDVFHNMITLYLGNIASDIKKVQKQFDDNIAAAEASVNKWAGIKDWSPLGEAGTTPASSSTSNPAQGQTSGSSLMANHLRDHSANITVLGGEPSIDIVQSLIDDLLTALSNEGAVLSAVYEQFTELAEEFATLSVGDIIKRIAAILVDGLLSSVQVVVDALFNVLYSIASSIAGILDTKIHIPVISDILNAIGIPDISFLDLFTWVAAVGCCVVYKVINGVAPFPDDANSQALISAASWDSLVALFAPASASDKAATHDASGLPIVLPKTVQTVVYIFGHITSAFCVFIGNIFDIFESLEETGDNPFSTPSAVLAAIGAVVDAATCVLVPKDPIDFQPVSIYNSGVSAAVILCKILFSGAVQEKFATAKSGFKNLAVNDGRAVGAVVNCVLIFPAFYCSCWHFYELSEKPAGKERSTAIVGEVANMCSYLSRLSYAVAVNDPEPVVKTASVIVMGVSNVAVCGLYAAEALLVDK
jgi:hypothetical protein